MTKRIWGRTISSSTSPAWNDSPSCFFHDAIPPSVIVGDMAGMPNLETAWRTALVRIPGHKRVSGSCTCNPGTKRHSHRLLEEARRAALEMRGRDCIVEVGVQVCSYVGGASRVNASESDGPGDCRNAKRVIGAGHLNDQTSHGYPVRPDMWSAAFSLASCRHLFRLYALSSFHALASASETLSKQAFIRESHTST